MRLDRQIKNAEINYGEIKKVKITKEKPGTVATVPGLKNLSINAGGDNESDFVFDYAAKQEMLQSKTFDLEISVRQFASAERLVRHRVFARLIAFLENKWIKHRGQILPSVLHPSTVQALLESDWTQNDIDEAEDSVYDDANYFRETEVWRSVPRGAFSELKKRNLERYIFDQKVVGIPNESVNRSACAELARRFSPSDLRLCNCFVQVRATDIGCLVWRIDIDERYSGKGFFVPVTDSDGLIKDLRVFRHLNDQRPFILRARRKTIGRAK